jgi:anti-anti-sigma regulatory factor
MLRISEQGNDGSLTLKLAGKLTGEWTHELERCWRAAIAMEPAPTVALDLSEVTFVSADGKRLLAAMAQAGVTLSATGILMSALVEQIAHGESFAEEPDWTSGPMRIDDTAQTCQDEASAQE